MYELITKDYSPELEKIEKDAKTYLINKNLASLFLKMDKEKRERKKRGILVNTDCEHLSWNREGNGEVDLERVTIDNHEGDSFSFGDYELKLKYCNGWELKLTENCPELDTQITILHLKQKKVILDS